MAHFLPPEHVRQVNKLEWPKMFSIFFFSTNVISHIHLFQSKKLSFTLTKEREKLYDQSSNAKSGKIKSSDKEVHKVSLV